MSTSSASAETPFIVPKRRSRRIWLFALIGIAVLATGWIGFLELDSRMRSKQVALYADQMQRPSAMNAVNQTFVSQPSPQDFAQRLHTNAQANPFAQSPPQNRQQPRKYYANPIQPQDPAESAATNEINQLSNQLRNATGEQKKELRKALNEAVGKLFDLRHAAQAKQVQKLEAELAEAKELLKKRSERKDEIVDRRIAELLQSADDLAWNREISGQPAPATNNPRLSFLETAPNASGYPQTTIPNSVYVVPDGGSYPSGSYQKYPVVPNPYGTAPTYSTTPGTLYSNPVPLSSTRPQLIPMLTPDSGQTNLLQSEPSSVAPNPTYSAPSTPTVSSTTVSPTNSSNHPLPLLNTSPEVVAQSFVAALQAGDTQVATFLLTSKAQEQMAAASFQLVQSPDAKFEIGRVGYPYEEKNVALVESTMSIPNQKSMEAVIECHLENGGWFIAGMALQANDQTIVFDFEDAASLKEPLTSTTTEPDTSLPVFVGIAKKAKQSTAETESQSTETQPSTITFEASTTKFGYSKELIEAAYAYEESLQVAIEGSSLWTRGLMNGSSYSSCKRKVAKAKAIWTAIGRALETRQRILLEEISAKEHEIESQKNSEAKREELLLARKKLVSELESLRETQAWAEDFQKQSLDPLEKQLAQSEEKKADAQAEE